MAVSVAEASQARPKLAGRPLAAPVAAFEGFFEALVAVEDDQEALEHARAGLSQIRALTSRLESHVIERVRRIEMAIAPELRRLVRIADVALTDKTAERRSAKSARTRAAAKALSGERS